MYNFMKFTLPVTVALVAIYVYWPPPELTKSVIKWKEQGKNFNYKSFDIFYHHTSNKDAASRTLVILHSFPASSFVWRDVVTRFKGAFKDIIIPDLLGLGFSDKPQGYNYTVHVQVDMIKSLLDTIGYHEIHVLAHDYGGTLSQELLARSNKGLSKIKVLSLVLLNGGIIPTTHQPLLVQRLFWQPSQLIKSVLKHSVSWLLFSWKFPALFGPDTQPSLENLTDIYSILMYKSGHCVLSDVMQFFHERHINEERWTGALQNTKIPLALIYGMQDQVNTKRVFLRRYKVAIPNSQVFTLENVGHYPYMEDLAGFENAYFRFLNSF